MSTGGGKMKPDKGYLREFFNLGTIFLLVLLVLVLVLLVSTFQMKSVSTYLLPRVLCIFCVIAITIALVIDFLKIVSRSRERENKKEALKGSNIFYTIIFAAVYFIVTPVLGFTLTTCAALIVFSYMSGYKNKKIIIPLAIALPPLFHFLFVSLLQVRLPEGVLESVFFFLSGR